MSITNRMESNHTMVTEGRQRIVRVLSTEYVDWLNEIRKLEAKNERLRGAARAVCDEAEKPSEALWELRAEIYRSEDAFKESA